MGETINENYTEFDEEESETNKNTSSNKIINTNSPYNTSANKEQVQFRLIDLIGINNNTNIDKYYKQILFAKLVSLNIFFYSNLSLCDSRFKLYLKHLFNIKDVIIKYLSIKPNAYADQSNQKNINNNLNNDLKCSLVQLLNFLYFRVPFPFWEKINLFKNLKTPSLGRSKTILNSPQKITP